MTMTAKPLNYTTKVPVRQTVGECQDILGSAGANAVAVLYEDREPVGLSFQLAMPAGRRSFTMPVNVDAMAKLMREANAAGKLAKPNGRPATIYNTRRHAAAVAWRVVKDWLEAQLAIIAAEMVTLDQVMLPYMRLDSGATLYEEIRDAGLALPRGAS